jgi:hypothetical protein
MIPSLCNPLAVVPPLIKVGEKNIQVIQILIVNMKCAMFKVYVIGNFKDATQITINTFKHEMLPT